MDILAQLESSCSLTFLSSRLSARQALRHQYFKELRDADKRRAKMMDITANFASPEPAPVANTQQEPIHLTAPPHKVGSRKFKGGEMYGSH